MTTMNKWEVGQSGNPNGRPKGTGRPVSKLRKTQRKLQELEEKALENIKKSVEGGIIDKEILSSSKWVITAILSISKAALAEEQSRKEEKNTETPEEDGSSSFSTSIVNGN